MPVLRLRQAIHFIIVAGLGPRLSGSAFLVAKATEIRRLLPLTLPLRGSLPLPARGERAGVRGHCRRRASNSMTIRGVMAARTTDFPEPDSREPE